MKHIFTNKSSVIFKIFKILTLEAVPVTLVTFLRVISTGLCDDHFRVGFGVVQCTSNVHGQVVVCGQGDVVLDSTKLKELIVRPAPYILATSQGRRWGKYPLIL